MLDLAVLESEGLIDLSPAFDVFAQGSLNAFMALGPKMWSRTRARISELLRHDNPQLRDNKILRASALVPMADVKLHLPIAVAGYTDFYSSKEHATNVGVMFRGKDNALQPNWLHMPIAYNGRASTVVVSGTKVRRPRGQLKPPGAEVPSFGPCKRLDFELEMGVVIGQPSVMGEMLSEKQAEAMIFGFVILNDWSARDIQQWEYVPLGPFQAKAFATSISPWIVTREALQPFCVPGPVQDPVPLPYLQQTQPHNYDLQLDVSLRAASMNEAATHLPHQFQIHVLVVGAATGAPRLVRLRHECRRSPGQRHHQRAGEGSARVLAGNQLERQRAGRTRQRRQPDVPRRRRLARDARLVPGQRFSRRVRRGRGDDRGGGVVPPPSPSLRGALATKQSIRRVAARWIMLRFDRGTADERSSQ